MVSKILQKWPNLGNKPLSIYNMLARDYTDDGKQAAFPAMTADLERVAEMKANTVYLNPFYAVGRYPKAEEGKIGSIYANSDMASTNPNFFEGRNESFFDNKKPTESGKQVQAFCKKAKELNIVPMFDLVQSHLSADSPYVAQAEAEGIDILKKDGDNWDIHNMDADYNKKKGMDWSDVWDDAVKFNFDDEKAKNFITDKILIPYVKEMADLGFRAIRVDSSPQAPQDVHNKVFGAFIEHVKKIDKLKNFHPAIVGETLNYGAHDRNETNGEELKGTQATHCYSSFYYAPNPGDQDFDHLFPAKMHGDGDYWPKAELWDKEKNSGTAPINPVSTHDVPRLWNQLSALFKEDLDTVAHNLSEGLHNFIGAHLSDMNESETLDAAKKSFFEASKGLSGAQETELIARWAKIKIATSALYSAGGYMVVSGDEFLADHDFSVFDGQVITNDSADYQSIMKQAKKHDYNKVFELDGVKYEKRVSFQHPVHHSGSNELVDVIVQRNPQMKMHEVIKNNKDTAKDLTDFITKVNERVANRKPIKEKTYADMYFSDADRDIFAVATYVNNNKVKPHPSYEFTVIDVSGKDREISKEIINELADKAKFSKHQLKDSNTFGIISTASAYQKQQGVPPR